MLLLEKPSYIEGLQLVTEDVLSGHRVYMNFKHPTTLFECIRAFEKFTCTYLGFEAILSHPRKSVHDRWPPTVIQLVVSPRAFNYQ